MGQTDGEVGAHRMSELAIPQDMDQVTPDWLSAVLSANADIGRCRVRAREIEDLNVEAGFVSNLARATLDYDDKPDEAPASVVVKLAPENEMARGFGKQLGLFQREVAFYSFFAADNPANPPRPYHAAIDDDGDAFAIVIEDLGVHDYGKFFDGASIAEAEAVMACLGRLHSRYWEGRNLEGHDWVPDLAQMTPMLVAMTAQAVPTFVERFGDHMPGFLRDGLGDAVAVYGEILNSITDTPNQTLCHVDTHLGNIQFQDGRARFLDWQAFMTNVHIYDVAYFLNGNLAIEDRRANLDRLLACYHRALSEEGIAQISLDDVVQAYHRQAAGQWVTIPLIAGAFLSNDERGEIMADAWLPRFFSAMEDSDAPARLNDWLAEVRA